MSGLLSYGNFFLLISLCPLISIWIEYYNNKKRSLDKDESKRIFLRCVSISCHLFFCTCSPVMITVRVSFSPQDVTLYINFPCENFLVFNRPGKWTGPESFVMLFWSSAQWGISFSSKCAQILFFTWCKAVVTKFNTCDGALCLRPFFNKTFEGNNMLLCSYTFALKEYLCSSLEKFPWCVHSQSHADSIVKA